MGRGPQAEKVPNLALALRFLRERAALTQAAVAERVSASGASLSRIYYQQIEGGSRFPSPIMRGQILEALGSNEREFAQLLTDRPWERSAVAPEGLRAPRAFGVATSARSLAPSSQRGLVPSDQPRLGAASGAPAPSDQDPSAAARAEIADLVGQLSLEELEKLLVKARSLQGD